MPSESDFPAGGVEGRYHLTYFGAAQPGARSFTLRPGTSYRAEIIDTWNMTVTPPTRASSPSRCRGDRTSRSA
ncbi:DUF5605 domain-containing protein [Streptomyces sp. NPDC006739]|uniref:DUF5605 domain-containing protein n=1 Tax=Streptomyces sp. NPDC006739 TaxID=3364763 RepID=UPI00367BB694